MVALFYDSVDLAKREEKKEEEKVVHENFFKNFTHLTGRKLFRFLLQSLCITG